MLKKLFIPFARVSKQTIIVVTIVQLIFILLFWTFTADGLYPTPLRVFKDFIGFLSDSDFYNNVFISLLLTCKAMLISIVIALFFAYSYTLSFFQPIVEFLSKCRYLTLTGILFVFMLVLKEGSSIKLSVLIFGIVPFFVTSLLSVIASITKENINQARALRFTPWETLYEIIILGKIDQALEVMRQNFAISWMMITTVETMSMNSGGIGVALFKFNKYNDINNIFALQLVIFLIGLLFDTGLSAFRKWLFPYTQIQKN